MTVQHIHPTHNENSCLQRENKVRWGSGKQLLQHQLALQVETTTKAHRHTCMCTHIHTHMQTHRHRHMHTQHTHAHKYTDTHTQCTHRQTDTSHTHRDTHTLHETICKHTCTEIQPCIYLQITEFTVRFYPSLEQCSKKSGQYKKTKTSRKPTNQPNTQTQHRMFRSHKHSRVSDRF